MPARMLTPSSIWNSFRSSHKRHLIITGGRGKGKTTLLQGLFDHPLRGITTYAVPQKAVYLRENGEETETVIGIYDLTAMGKENKMRPWMGAFATHGVACLERLAQCEDEWVSLDEIGYLETDCPAYCRAVESLMEQKRVVAVVRKQSLGFLQALCSREDVFLVDLDEPFSGLACVIMASGMGTRFGGNKLMADFHGKPLIHYAIAATEGIFEKRVVVTRHGDVAELCRMYDIPCVLHDLPHRNDTVRLGLEAVGDMRGVVFCPGDQPLLRRETVIALALAAQNTPEDIWRVRFEETPGAPVLFPRWTFAELAALPEGKGGGFVMGKYPERLRTVSAGDRLELMDADTAKDLDFLRRQ